MKFTCFTGSFIGKTLLVILCIFLGIILTLGGIVLGGYVVLTKEGMVGTIGDKVAGTVGKENSMPVEVKNQSVLAWGKDVISAVQNLNASAETATTIGGLENLIGMHIISETVENALGVDAEKIREASVSTIGETVTDNLTVRAIRDNFDVAFPEMPLFEESPDNQFLAKPLSKAFENFDDYTLKEVIEIKDDANAVLKKLKDTRIKDLGTGTTDELIKSMKLGEVIDIGENSNAVLRELKNTKIGDIGAETTDNVVKSMFLCEMMTIDEESNMTLKALKYSCVESQYSAPVEGTEYFKKTGESYASCGEFTEGDSLEGFPKGYFIKNEDGVYSPPYRTKEIDGEARPLKGINDRIDELRICDVVEITGESNAVLRKMRKPRAGEEENLFGTEDLLVKDLGGSKVTEIVNETKIGEIIEVNNGSEPILKALEDTPVSGLNGKINSLKLNEIFKETQISSGALCLIPADTKITEIPVEMQKAILNATTATFKGNGLIASSTFYNVNGMPIEQEAFIYNSGIGEMMKGIIEFITNPYETLTYSPYVKVNYDCISPKRKTPVANYSSLEEFVNSYDQYDTLSYEGEGELIVTVTVGEGDSVFKPGESEIYCVPLFNVDGNITFDFGGKSVELAVYDKEEQTDLPKGYKYTGVARHQYGFVYAKNAGGELPVEIWHTDNPETEEIEGTEYLTKQE